MLFNIPYIQYSSSIQSKSVKTLKTELKIIPDVFSVCFSNLVRHGDMELNDINENPKNARSVFFSRL